MITNLSYSEASLSSTFLSTIDSLKASSYSKVFTLTQSLNFVYWIFNFDLYSFVIKMAILVKKAVLLVNTIPMLGTIIENVKVVFSQPDPKNISAINNKTFFFKLSYLFQQ